MKKIIILFLSVICMKNIFAADGHLLNTDNSTIFDITMHVHKTGVDGNEKKPGLFRRLLNNKARIKLTKNHSDADYSHMVLEYQDPDRLVERSMAIHTISNNDDCGCKLYYGEIPEGEVNDFVSINLTFHTCPIATERHHTAHIVSGNGWCGLGNSYMLLRSPVE